MLTDSSLQSACELLLYDEGFEQYPYNDQTGEQIKIPGATATFGIGFTYITMPEAMMILKNRVPNMCAEINRKWSPFSELDDVRKIVCLDIAYNVGIQGFLEFRDMTDFMAVKDWVHASHACMDSLVAVQEHIRYTRLSEMILTGKLPDVISTHSSSA